MATGLVTRRELRSTAWRRLFRDVYACSTVPHTHEVRARAAASVLLPGAVVSGRSAAVLWGLDLAAADDPVELTVPPGAPACTVPGVRVLRRALNPGDIVELAVRRTSPAATAVALSRVGTLDEAVVLVDRFVATGRVHLVDVQACAATATGRGCRQARAAAALADGLAESPQETRLRLVLHRSSLPDPVAQHPVRHRGSFVARVDFAWPGRKLALEYDGQWHRDPRQFAADRARLNRLTAAGWRVVFVTAADLRDPRSLLARLAAELAR